MYWNHRASHVHIFLNHGSNAISKFTSLGPHHLAGVLLINFCHHEVCAGGRESHEVSTTDHHTIWANNGDVLWQHRLKYWRRCWCWQSCWWGYWRRLDSWSCLLFFFAGTEAVVSLSGRNTLWNGTMTSSFSISTERSSRNQPMILTVADFLVPLTSTTTSSSGSSLLKLTRDSFTGRRWRCLLCRHSAMAGERERRRWGGRIASYLLFQFSKVTLYHSSSWLRMKQLNHLPSWRPSKFWPIWKDMLARQIILVQYSDKFMHSIVKFLIVLLHSLLLCFCTVLLCEVNTIQCHA